MFELVHLAISDNTRKNNDSNNVIVQSTELKKKPLTLTNFVSKFELVYLTISDNI